MAGGNTCFQQLPAGSRSSGFFFFLCGMSSEGYQEELTFPGISSMTAESHLPPRLTHRTWITIIIVPPNKQVINKRLHRGNGRRSDGFLFWRNAAPQQRCSHLSSRWSCRRSARPIYRTSVRLKPDNHIRRGISNMNPQHRTSCPPT